MLLMVSIVLGIFLAFAFAILMVISSGYAAYLSIRRARDAEHLRHYHLHLLEESLRM